MNEDEIIRKAIGVFYDRIVADEDWKRMKKDNQLGPVLEVAKACIKIAYKQGYDDATLEASDEINSNYNNNEDNG